MKFFSTYILLLALTLQSFYCSIMTVEYQLHLPDYIAQCINKDRPQLHCNGQCLLMKKIKEKEKKESKKDALAYKYSTPYLHKECTIVNLYEVEEESFQRSLFSYQNEYRFIYHNSIFRPPVS